MKTKSRTILIISISCIAAGILLAGAGRLLGGRPGYQITGTGLYSASNSGDVYRLEKTRLDRFTDLEVTVAGNADIELLPSDDEDFYLEYALDAAYNEPQWEISSDTFTLSQSGGGSLGTLFFFGSDFGIQSRDSCFIRIYIPAASSLSSVCVRDDAGNLDISGLSAEKASFDVDFGNLTVTGSTFGTLELYNDSGTTEVADTSAGSVISQNSFGSSSLKSVTAENVDITAESGSITLDVAGLETLTGNNEFGSTQIMLHDPLSSFSCQLETEFGSIQLPGSYEGRYISDGFGEESYSHETGGTRSLIFTAESGDITIREK